jgi:hypothetical protein
MVVLLLLLQGQLQQFQHHLHYQVSLLQPAPLQG